MVEDVERRLARRAVDAVSDVPQEFRASLASVLLAHWLTRGSTSGPQPVRSSIAVGLNEVMASVGRRSQPEQLVVIAAYRLDTGSPAVTREEFLGAYEELRTPPPQNMSEQIARCIRRGWLNRAEDRDGAATWRVTQTGLGLYRSWMPANDGGS